MPSNSFFKTQDLPDNKIHTYFNKFIQWMNEVGSFKNCSETDIKKYFTEKFDYITDDSVTATNAAELATLIENAKKKFKSAFINFPISDLSINESKVHASYTVTFTEINDHTYRRLNDIHVEFNQNGKVEKFQQYYQFVNENSCKR